MTDPKALADTMRILVDPVAQRLGFTPTARERIQIDTTWQIVALLAPLTPAEQRAVLAGVAQNLKPLATP